MKKNYTLFLMFVLFVFAVRAQTVLTENTGNTIVGEASVACPSGENSVAREFTLADFGITTDFQLTDGEFGIEDFEGVARSITVNVYDSDGAFPANYPGTLLGSEVVSVPATAASLSVFSYTFTNPITILAGTTHIAVELVQSDQDASGLFIGATAAQTDVCYIKSGVCGLDTYTDPATLGFTDAKFYIVVSGNTLGVENFSKENVSIYPNPVKDFLNIELQSGSAIISTEIYSVTGKLVYNGNSKASINVSNLNSGIYLLKVNTANGQIVKKIIKK